jgi:uncharacterized protein YlzI (FlbEa/FlbD family)
VLHGGIHVNDEVHVVDVNTTGCHICRNKDLDRAIAKRSKVSIPGWRESLRQFLGVVLSAHEEDSTPCPGGQCVDEVLFRLNARGLEHVVGHLDDGRVLLVHRVHDLVVEETVHELVDTVIQCRREQQTLP